ncbi:MAG: hypothetical protein AAGI15_14890 [Pseudomonadota bacterium]
MAATITDVRLAAAHEGIAELVVILTHGNGGRSEVALDHHAANALLAEAGSEDLAALRGMGWQSVQRALAASWNRYQQGSEHV